jgi:hypothetical protein
VGGIRSCAGQNLAGRRKVYGLDFLARPLCGRVKAAHAFNLVTEQLDAGG